MVADGARLMKEDVPAYPGIEIVNVAACCVIQDPRIHGLLYPPLDADPPNAKAAYAVDNDVGSNPEPPTEIPMVIGIPVNENSSPGDVTHVSQLILYAPAGIVKIPLGEYVIPSGLPDGLSVGPTPTGLNIVGMDCPLVTEFSG